MTTVDDIRAQLQQLGLDSRGNKSTIKARLRKYMKKEQNNNPNNAYSNDDNDGNDNANNDREAAAASLTAEKLTGRKKKAQARTADAEAEDTSDRAVSPTLIEKNSRYDYMLAFDVEATCESGISFEFPNEVIEFPVVLLDGKTLEVVKKKELYSLFMRTLSMVLQGLIVQLIRFYCSGTLCFLDRRVPIICSAHQSPEIKPILHGSHRNPAGKIKTTNGIKELHGDDHNIPLPNPCFILILWRYLINRRRSTTHQHS